MARKGWLLRQIRESVRELEQWPKWMIREAGLHDTLKTLKDFLKKNKPRQGVTNR